MSTRALLACKVIFPVRYVVLRWLCAWGGFLVSWAVLPVPAQSVVEQPDLPIRACPTVCSPVKSKVIQALGDYNKLNDIIPV